MSDTIKNVEEKNGVIIIRAIFFMPSPTLLRTEGSSLASFIMFPT